LGALSHIRVLDLSRVLAGPWASQILADLGADVIKIEHPRGGDESRAWGPPFARHEDGTTSDVSAYFLCTNRNKKSVTVDFAQHEGQDIVRRLAQQSDVTAIRRLEKMARITGSDGTPPRVKIRAQGSHISFQNRTWIIDSLTWGDALMSKNGNRLRQAASVGLLEYIRDTHLADKSASARRRQKATASKKKAGASTKRKVASKRGPTTGKKTILVDTFADPASGFGMGEDLASIAARELGDADRWPEIAQLNGIRDPRAVFPGQVLRLP